MIFENREDMMDIVKAALCGFLLGALMALPFACAVHDALLVKDKPLTCCSE